MVQHIVFPRQVKEIGKGESFFNFYGKSMYLKNSNVAQTNEDKLLPLSQLTQVEAVPKYRCDLCGKECKSEGGRTLP